MNRFYLLFILLFLSKLVSSQATCDTAVPFCNDFGSPETVVNGGNAEVGPDYGCLETQPNPSWSLLKIQTAGTMELEISQVKDTGEGIDVDYICYGPFNDPITPCQGGQLTAANTVNCSFLPDSVEHLTIPNTQVGEYYLILITNYEGFDGTLTFKQTNEGAGNAGESDCSIVCTIALEDDTSVCIDSDYTLTSTLGNSSIEATYKWFKNGVEIVGATDDTYVVNSTVISTDTYKVEINSDTCEDKSEDEIVINFVDITSNLKLVNINSIDKCDNDSNGFDNFDLTVNEDEIANLENASDFTFTYFKDIALTQQIGNPTNYTNTIDHIETIYVTIKHTAFFGCVNQTQFEIKAIDSPTLTKPNDWLVCDDDTDGFFNFDLNSLTEGILNGQDENKYGVTFHLLQEDADNGINPIMSPYTNILANEMEEIFIRIENSAIPTCYETASFNINVIRLPIANPIPNWIVCDDADNDGFYLFDFTTKFNSLLNGQDETLINISFHKSQVDADFNIVPYELNYTNQESFIEEDIFVRMESVENTDCFGTASFKIEVIQNPIFDLVEETKYICVNLLPQTVIFEIENLQGNYAISWQDTLGNELSTTTTFNAESAGDYTVTATTIDGNNCTTTKTVHLLPAEPASNIEFIMNEFWHEETFSLEISVLGSGVYQYALDDISGPYQEEPLLTNIKPGVHTIYVKEMNDCGVTSLPVKVFGFSPFFTPNNDGQHDIWKVQGINFKPSAKIHIFDRYGKLMKTFFPALEQGWDGFYNGRPAPEGDYWFTAEMTDHNGNPKIRKGHFSLLRTNN